MISGLKQIREHYGLSLRELSDLTQITVANLNRIERGLQKPTKETIKRIELSLDIKYWYEIHTVNTLEVPNIKLKTIDADWTACVSEFYILCRMLKSLPYLKRCAFIHSAINHLKTLIKKKK
jgi:transcriptional regulator with XRE-family HTH domain